MQQQCPLNHYQSVASTSHTEQEPSTAINEPFLKQVQDKLNPSRILSHLKCYLCNGYFRYPYTIITCGDTFCRECIFKHLKTKQAPCCPKCLTSDQSKSIDERFMMRDDFKQKLVDQLMREYKDRDTKVIEAVNKALRVDLNYLLSDEISTKEVKNSSSEGFKLFAEQVVETSKVIRKFAKELQHIEQLNYELPEVVILQPKSDKDYEMVELRGKMKFRQQNIRLIKNQIEKRMLRNGISKGQLPADMKYSVNLSIKDCCIDDINFPTLDKISKTTKNERLVITYSIDPSSD